MGIFAFAEFLFINGKRWETQRNAFLTCNFFNAKTMLFLQSKKITDPIFVEMWREKRVSLPMPQLASKKKNPWSFWSNMEQVKITWSSWSYMEQVKITWSSWSYMEQVKITWSRWRLPGAAGVIWRSLSYMEQMELPWIIW
jgi:hypothetical protein